MSLVSLGASYKTLPFEQLERIAIPREAVSESLVELAATEGVSGALILSTCNRIELYVDAKTDRIGNDACRRLFESRGVTDFSGFYLERGDAVPRHLFRVVCSLDSQVLGETQVLGQVKEAFAQATEAGTCTEVLTRLFKDALAIGKRVRSETTIGLDSVSLSTSAFKVATQEFGDISACRILFIGAGEMAALSLAYLVEAGASDFLVTSRTPEHARAFADNCKGRAIPFGQRYEAMATADIVFAMTSANDIVVEAEKLDKARREAGTNRRKLLIIDQAMPRDVQAECNELSGATLYTIETLGRIIDEGIAVRMSAVGETERMIAEAVRGFLAWMQQRTVTPTIREMYSKGAATVESEFVRAVKALESQRGGAPLTPEERDTLEAYGTAIMKKILHGPTARLRREAETESSYYYTGAARYLFGLDSYPPGCVPHACPDKPCLRGELCAKGLMT